jgi:tetratricopeptide (TPR) repeat protein
MKKTRLFAMVASFLKKRRVLSRACGFIESRDFKRSLSELEKLNDTTDPNARLVKSMAYCGLQKFDHALAELELIIAADLQNSVALTLKGEVQRKTKQINAAVETLLLANDLDGGNARILYQLALAYLALKQVEKSEYYFEQVLKNDPHLWKVKVLLASESILMNGAN